MLKKFEKIKQNENKEMIRNVQKIYDPQKM